MRLSLLLATLAILSGCTDAGAPPVLHLAISPRVGSLAMGDSLQLAAVVSATSGPVPSGHAVAWASTDTAILTVTATGLVHAVNPGEATISARAANAQDTLSISVAVSFASLAASPSVLCGVATTGAGYCQGYNALGGLGNGSTDSASSFVAVAGGHRFRAILPGIESTCGLTTDSLAYCWGYGGVGSLGTGDTLTRLVPTPVAGGLRFAAIAQGELHACGLSQLGTPYCWGWQLPGQSGDPSVPSAVVGSPAFVRITAGGNTNCGLTPSSAAYCWGDNRLGQVGAVTDTVFHAPVTVQGGQTYAALSVHGVVCGLTLSGNVYCWGGGAYDFDGAVSPTLQRLPAGVTFVAISTAYPHICGVGSDSAMYCWLPERAPSMIPGGLKFTQVGSGTYHDCGITVDSAAYCWLFHCGSALDVSCSTPPVPRPVPGSVKFKAVSGGGENDSCGLAADGSVSCWRVDQDSNTTPVPVPGGLTFHSLTVGDGDLRPLPYGPFGCGLAADSTAWCWTLGGGMGTPQPVPGGLAYVSFDAYSDHTCGIGTTGAAYCWFHTDPGPVLVPGGGDFVSVATSYFSDCAITTSGTVSCWGSNTEGDLGLGYASSHPLVPAAVMGGRSFSTVTTSGDHTCALTADSTAYCWGSNATGMLGTGDTTPSIAPVPVATGLRFASLATGPYLTCGLSGDGAAYCWGRGALTPVLQQPGTSFTTLAADDDSRVCGITKAGDVTCWAAAPAPVARRPAPRPGLHLFRPDLGRR